jgi:AraC-like DNA-binding protein
MPLIGRLQIAAGELEVMSERSVDRVLRDIVESAAAIDWRSVPLVEFIVARSLVAEFFFELAKRQGFDLIAPHVLTRLGMATAESFTAIVADAFSGPRLRLIVTAGSLDQRVRTTLESIRSTCCEHRIRVDELAGAVGLSRWHLERLTKRQTGASLRQHVVSARLDRAINLLKHGPLPIKELAFRVGYGNANAFSRDFRRWYGASPRAWLRTP